MAKEMQMFYKVLMDGAGFKAGEVLDIGDPEYAETVRQQLKGALEELPAPPTGWEYTESDVIAPVAPPAAEAEPAPTPVVEKPKAAVEEVDDPAPARHKWSKPKGA